MSSGSSKAPSSQTITQTNLPEYAQPYVTDIMQRAQGEANRPYTPYEGQRIAEFTPEQQQAQSGVMGLQAPQQITTASNLAGAAGLGALSASQYNPATFNAQQVRTRMQGAPQMQGQQTNYDPNLSNFQIDNPQNFGTQQAQQYMSPYFQQVLDVQKDEAVRDAQKAQLGQNLASVNQGTYGGARQLLAQTERERNLGQQLGDIQAKGSQAAYENAQQQFERDRAAGLGVAGQNLQSALGVQQLGAQTGTQLTLANLSNEQQAAVQNQAAMLQTQGLNAQQAMQAALANQQANMQAQQASEQSRQFGSQQGLAGLAQATQSAQTLGSLGATQQQSDLARLQAQMGVGQQTQQQQQSLLDQQYADFLRQRDYPLEQLGYYSNLVRGMPLGLGSTETTYAPPQSTGAQVAGLGLNALGMYNMSKGT